MRGACPKCGRIVGANFPKGGDGSAVRLRSHTDPILDLLCYGQRIIDLSDIIDPPAARPSSTRGGDDSE